MLLHSINPATGKTLRSFPALTEEALRDRITLSAEAASVHAALPMEHRTRCLRKLAGLFAAEKDELARTVALETGRPIRYAAAEIGSCAEACNYYAENGARMLAPELLQKSGTSVGRKTQSYIALRPVGVVLAVMPSESPLWHACRVVIPALTAGNAVLLKPAMSVPQCALLLETLLRRAGFLRGTLNALLTEDRLVEAALHDKRVSAVTVVGAESVARAIAAQAGSLLKKSSLYVLGNGVTVVMPSADPDAALAAAVHAVVSGGEAGKRLIVSSGIYNDFVQRLVKTVEALPVGDPQKQETEVGPVGTAAAVEAISEQVRAVVDAGGRILTGGTRLVGRGIFFEPTLLSDVPRESPIAQVVLSGPLLMIFRSRDVEDAISLANCLSFSGESSVWTREPTEQQQLIDGIRSKAITLNASPGQDGRLCASALREFTEAKIVTLS
jgi:succinate-semialdehyde dehydrogenase/glutarate-semialdehyde dehydrogenase